MIPNVPFHFLNQIRNKLFLSGNIFHRFYGAHELIPSKTAFFLKTENLKGPMGGVYALFKNLENLKKVRQEYPGTVINWNEVNKHEIPAHHIISPVV